MYHYEILKQRKQLKENGHSLLKRHYVILFFLTLVMIFFGTEYSVSKSALGRNLLSYPESGTEDWETDESDGSVLDGSTVLNTILARRLQEDTDQEEISGSTGDEGDLSDTLGMTRGVLAQAVVSVSSGKPYAMLIDALFSIFHSDSAVAVVFILLSTLWYALLFILLKNVYSAVYRRVILETRIYDRISPGSLLHFAAVRRWFRACRVMLVREVYGFLWSLTIVGGIIKSYSYFAVPFIVAENPDVRANEAITLSRRMMDGHKWELFLFRMTQLGWVLLGLITFGVTDLLYGAPYRAACEAEFYVKIREDAVSRKISGAELLNDPCLFEKADSILLYETYFPVVDEITQIHEERIELRGVRKFAAEWFSVWLGTTKKKKKYDELEGRKYAVSHYKLCMEGKSYPQWLNVLWRKKELAKLGHFSFLRQYTVWTLFLLFISFSFLGWSWEVALHYMQTGELVNRGTLLGPWLPIYGEGGVIVLLLCSRFRKNPVIEFIMSIVLCGILEYTIAWYLETRFHQRWWSYDGYFLNLHGRICAEGLLVFGIGCCIVVYLIAPLFDVLLSRVKTKILIPVCTVLMVFFAADQIHANTHPNMAKGAVEEQGRSASSGSGDETEAHF